MPYDIADPIINRYITDCITHFRNSPIPLERCELDQKHASFIGVPMKEASWSLPGMAIVETYVKLTVRNLVNREWDTFEKAEVDIKNYFGTHPFRLYFTTLFNQTQWFEFIGKGFEDHPSIEMRPDGRLVVPAGYSEIELLEMLGVKVMFPSDSKQGE